MLLAEVFAGLVMLLAYVLIVAERVHRTIVAAGGGALILLFGRYVGLIEREEYPSEIHFMASAIDWNTIGLLLGMMIIVGIIKETGIFEFLAVKAAKLSRGEPLRIMLLFSSITAILSAFLDNVTTVLLIAPVTVSITLNLGLKPVPFLLAEVFASNVGGAATLIGDPPNIIIGSGAGLGFNAFIFNVAPIIVLIFPVLLLLIKLAFREELARESEHISKVMAMNEWDEIKDRALLKNSLLVLGMVIILFFLHSMLHLEPATVALFGAVILLLTSRKHPDEALHQVEWSVLLFFAGLFVMVKGVEEAGLLELAAINAVELTGGNLASATFVILWLSAIASAIVDNIPFTATMIPIVQSMSSNPAVASQIASTGENPLWWALSLGACLGGNATLVAASANVVVAGISERMGYPISFREFFKYGAPITFITVLLSGVLLYVKAFLI